MSEIGIIVAFLMFALGLACGYAYKKPRDVAAYDAETARMKKTNDLVEKLEIWLGYDVPDEVRRRHPEEPIAGLSCATREVSQ